MASSGPSAVAGRRGTGTSLVRWLRIPDDVDVVFIGAFTEAAHTAYALSNLFRGRGAITAIGGPHARCYPEDAARYFDYVLGFTDKDTLLDVLQDRSQHRPMGIHLAAFQQPRTL